MVDQRPATESASSHLPLTDRGTALIVENDPHLRSLLEHFLGRQGYSVRSFASGVAADQYLASGGALGLVLVDGILPEGESGFDWLCDCESLRGIPAVAISSSGPATISGRERLGDIPFLLNPFTLESLEDAISRACPAPAAGPESEPN